MANFDAVMAEVVTGLRDVVAYDLSPPVEATSFPPAVRIGSNGLNYLFLPFFEGEHLRVEVMGFEQSGRRALHLFLDIAH